jgi:hypothetical protein
MIVRAAAAEGARAAVHQASDGNVLLGFLAALFTEGALVALDKPDTRSWQLLPDAVYVHRQSVSPGEHTVEVRIGPGEGEKYVRKLEAPPNGWAAVIITAPR